MRIILLFLITLNSFLIFGQVIFNKIDTSTNALAHCLFLDTSFVLVGQIRFDSGTLSSTLQHYNFNGDLIRVDTLANDSKIELVSDIMKKENEVIIYSTSNDLLPFSDENYDLKLSKIPENSDTFVTWEYGGNNYDGAVSMLEVNDQIYLISSSSSFGSPTSTYIIKTNQNGDILDEFVVSDNGHIIPYKACNTPDDNILITGVEYDLNQFEWSMYIAMFDTIGNQIWHHRYENNLRTAPMCLQPLKDRTVLVGTYKKHQDGTYTGYIEKIDLDGKVIWRKSFPNQFGYSIPQDFLANNDGTVMFIMNSKTNSSRVNGNLIKIDPLGNIIWTKEYSNNSSISDYFWLISDSPGFGYLITGYSYINNHAKGLMIGTNCWGEENSLYPIDHLDCEEYNCTFFPINADIMTDNDLLNIGVYDLVTFQNNSTNATSRVWTINDSINIYSDSIVPFYIDRQGLHKIELTVYHGVCSEMSQISFNINKISELGELNSINLSVYPNPSNGKFYIESNFPFSGTIIIFDVNGRKIQELQTTSDLKKINLSIKKPGIYYLQYIQKEGGSSIQKIIVV